MLQWTWGCMYLFKLVFSISSDKYPEMKWLNHMIGLYLVFFRNFHAVFQGFPGSSAGKESPCNAGDTSLIPGSGSSPGEGIGYPLQYSWSSLVAQMVKNLPATWETWVWSLGWEDSLEEGIATHSSILVWRIPMDRGTWWATVHGVTKSQIWVSNQAQHSLHCR